MSINNEYNFKARIFKNIFQKRTFVAELPQLLAEQIEKKSRTKKSCIQHKIWNAFQHYKNIITEFRMFSYSKAKYLNKQFIAHIRQFTL